MPENSRHDQLKRDRLACTRTTYHVPVNSLGLHNYNLMNYSTIPMLLISGWFWRLLSTWQQKLNPNSFFLSNGRNTSLQGACFSLESLFSRLLWEMSGTSSATWMQLGPIFNPGLKAFVTCPWYLILTILLRHLPPLCQLVFWLRYKEYYMSARSEILNFFARIQLDVSPVSTASVRVRNQVEHESARRGF